jgi:hypothetical protein
VRVVPRRPPPGPPPGAATAPSFRDGQLIPR